MVHSDSTYQASQNAFKVLSEVGVEDPADRGQHILTIHIWMCQSCPVFSPAADTSAPLFTHVSRTYA